MVSEIDICRAANLLIRQHAAAAASQATQRAGQMLDRDDSDGWHTWAPIRLAVEALQAPRMGKPN